MPIRFLYLYATWLCYFDYRKAPIEINRVLYISLDNEQRWRRIIFEEEQQDKIRDATTPTIFIEKNCNTSYGNTEDWRSVYFTKKVLYYDYIRNIIGVSAIYLSLFVKKIGTATIILLSNSVLVQLSYS